MKFLGTLSFLIFCYSSHATFIDADLIRKDLTPQSITQIDQAEFDLRIQQLQETFAPLVQQHGGRLSIKGLWSKDQIVARATQMFGSWKIEFSGGLARRPELTPDGMTLIICHEIGHHLGGFPFASGTPFGGYWASVEGQADYYSTQVCARKLWANEEAINATRALAVDPVAQAECDLMYQAIAERQLCYRVNEASASVVQTMAGLLNRPMPQFSTPDATVRSATNENHPAIQCRLDTLFHGSLCPTIFDDRLIPGKRTEGGRTSLAAEREAANSSCSAMSNFTRGLRPTCWFKARL